MYKYQFTLRFKIREEAGREAEEKSCDNCGPVRFSMDSYFTGAC
jgi:hypothetical protein